MNTTTTDTVFPTARDIVHEKNKDKTALRSKVMKLRMEIKTKGFKKQGHNKYQNYDHYTIDDILEVAYPLLCKYNISTWYDFNVENRIATLEITDLDTGYTDVVSIEDPLFTYKNANEALQGIGKSQTYLRKYLYIQFLDISENDPDENFGQTHYNKQDTKDKNQKQENNQKQTITYKIPRAIQIILTELQEKNIKPTRKTLRDHTIKQLQQKIITQKEYNQLQNLIQQIPEDQLKKIY